VEVAACWQDHAWSRIESFANVERTTDGGTHVDGFVQGLCSGLKQTIPSACVSKTPKHLERVVSSGLTAIVCVRLNDPTYGEPTKSRLVTPEAKAAVKACVSDAFRHFLQNDTTAAEHFASRIANGRSTAHLPARR